MAKQYLESKICPGCNNLLSSLEFVKDTSRKDGMKTLCKKCEKTHIPSGTKRKITSIVKKCVSCERVLPGRKFASFSKSKDGLSDVCRSCKCWKQRGSQPTLEEVSEFDECVKRCIRAASEYASPYEQRVIFEHFFMKEFKRSGFDSKWKTPVWLDLRIGDDS